jgi:GMP synthase (glutamine-hydrolysing)
MKKIKLHVIQHVEFERPGVIVDWVKENGHELTFTYSYNGGQLPDVENVDILVILGGPMSVNAITAYDWIEPEKQFIRLCINKGKSILGICLGAQLIALALNEKVYPGPEKEIGWFPVQFHKSLNKIFPKELTVFHWHGETFDIPSEAIPLCSSEAVKNQGFIYRDQAIALQFHLEVKKENVQALIENCREDITEEPYVQSEEKILSEEMPYTENGQIMKHVLSFLSDRVN